MSSQLSDESDRRKNFFCHSCSANFLKHPDAVSAPSVDLQFYGKIPRKNRLQYFA
jgi:hypothetical protein